jgi:Domain of unknown function (DUF6436)
MAGSANAFLRRNPLASHAFAWLGLATWLLTAAAAFWWFELRDWRPFSTPGAPLFEMHGAAQAQIWFRTHVGVDASAPGHLTFVHLYSPNCRCNGNTEAHLQRLVDQYQSRGVRFLAALSPTFNDRAATSPHPLGLPVVVSSDRLLSAAGVNTAPAALIFDAAGRLIYYGPYSDSAWCGSQGGLVEPILDRALTRRQPSGGAPMVRGCFCAW